MPAQSVWVGEASEFDLEVDQANADTGEHALEEVVDAQCHGDDLVDLALCRPTKGVDVLFGDQRITQIVAFQAEFHDRPRQLFALFHAQALGHGSGGDIATDHFQRNDLYLLDQLLAHVQTADKMRRNADLCQTQHDKLGNAIVQHALAVERGFLLRVERGGVVLEILDERTRLRPLIEDLGLAFVDLLAATHGAALRVARPAAYTPFIAPAMRPH